MTHGPGSQGPVNHDMPLLFSYGTVFEVTDRELVLFDEYERAFSYGRVTAELASGGEAWVYVHASPSRSGG